jgi:predicted dithiol-disulfide oxidoreductase (DUF899 family)
LSFGLHRAPGFEQAVLLPDAAILPIARVDEGQPVTLVTPAVGIRSKIRRYIYLMADNRQVASRRALARPKEAARVDRAPDGQARAMQDTRRKERRAMTTHKTGTHDEWLAARRELLDAEKEVTRRSDEVARRRQELPWVRIDKEYRFETDDGSATLKDLFRGRSQLLVYHFMFGPDYAAGCPSCSSIADGFNGFMVHLANHDVMLWAVSRAPLAKLQAYKRRMGWSFPWASSFGSDFNYDFQVSFTKEQQQSGAVEYNFGTMDTRSDLTDPQTLAVFGTDAATTTREAPGMSAFALEDGLVYHTYSAYIRGLDGLWGMYQWLDRAPKGRNETMIRGFGRLRGSFWYRRHDEYDKP